MRILLIDDSAAYREEFAVLLADARVRHSVLDFATTSAQGAALIAAGVHDLYIVDYRLPGGDGLSLVRSARETGITTPIIVLTGYGSPMIDEAALEAGATDYLPKGEFSPQILGRSIRYAVRNAAAVKAAKDAESRFRMAQEVAGIGTWDWDTRANTKIWSGPMRALYGLDPNGTEPVSYDTWSLAVHPDDRDMARAALAGAVLGHAPYDIRYRILRPDPSRPNAAPELRWIAAKGEVLRDVTGVPYRMIGINFDITDQQNAMAALQAGQTRAAAGLRLSEARFKTYFESAVECLFHARRDLDGAFRYELVNQCGLEQAGKTIDEVVGRTPVDVLGPQAGGIKTEALRRVYETREPYRFEATYNLPKGPMVIDAIYVPFFDEASDVTGVLGSARDITERRRLEASLHQAQKMEALGQLSGGVAHDFNNLLTGILGCFELLGRQVTSDKGRKLVSQGVRAVERSTALTNRLLAFSRQQPLTTEPVDINVSLDEITEMLSRTLGADVRIGKTFAADLWPAITDRNQIELAILNLGINARDAMPVGGTLTISTRNKTVTEPQGDLAAGDYVAVTITDTGTGMTPEVLARVTEPFYTTKAPGKGTGLGLSMVAGVVKQLGGGLTITSTVGKGTSVTLFLPRAPAGVLAAVQNLPTRPTASVSILLVDDDLDTQTAVAAYAAEAGHGVTVAETAENALSVLDTGREVEVMIVDGTLPGMPLSELVEQAYRRRPGLSVLVVSGQTRGPELNGFPVLAKPFRQDAFDAAVAALIKQSKPSATVISLRPGNQQPRSA